MHKGTTSYIPRLEAGKPISQQMNKRPFHLGQADSHIFPPYLT